MRRSRPVGVGMSAVGVAVLASSAALTFTKVGATTSKPHAASATATKGTSTPGKTGTKGGTAAGPTETPVRFFAELTTAMRTGNTAFLLARLNPAVVMHFGERLCLTYLPKLTDPTASFTVVSVGTPETFTYKTGTFSTTVADAIPVVLDVTNRGTVSQETGHVVPNASGKLTWFTDCSGGATTSTSTGSPSTTG